MGGERNGCGRRRNLERGALFHNKKQNIAASIYNYIILYTIIHRLLYTTTGATGFS